MVVRTRREALAEPKPLRVSQVDEMGTEPHWILLSVRGEVTFGRRFGVGALLWAHARARRRGARANTAKVVNAHRGPQATLTVVDLEVSLNGAGAI